MTELRGHGYQVVRWFVLGDGRTWGRPGAGVPSEDTRTTWGGHRQWRFDPAAARGDAAAIVEDFEALLTTFDRANQAPVQVRNTRREAPPIKLMPAIHSFELAYLGSPAGGGFVAGGRADYIHDVAGASSRAKTEAFFATLLDPLLAAAGRHAASVEAIDLWNEPEWCTYPDGTRPGNPRTQTLPRSRMARFLRECAARVRRVRSLRATVGFAKAESLRDTGWSLGSMGLDVYQYHYYGEPRAIPDAGTLPGPCIVGEFGAMPGFPWDDAAGCHGSGVDREHCNNIVRNDPYRRTDHSWPELRRGGDQSVRARLCHLEARHYEAAMVWSRFAWDKHSPFSTDIAGMDNDVNAFVSGGCGR